MKIITSKLTYAATLVALTLVTIGAVVIGTSAPSALGIAVGVVLICIGVLSTLVLYCERIVRAQRRRGDDIQKILRYVRATAGSVGGAAPVIRGVQKTVEEVKTIAKGSQGRDGSELRLLAGPQINKIVLQHSEAPSGHADVYVELQGRQQPRRRILPFVTLNQQVLLDSGAANRAVIDVPKEGLHWEFEAAGQNYLDVYVRVLGGTGPVEHKAAVLTAEAYDNSGHPITFRTLHNKSEKYGYFQYISNRRSPDKPVRVNLPEAAKRVKLSLYPWANNIIVENSVQASSCARNPDWVKTRRMSDIRVAAILDEFSFNSFGPECDMFEVTPAKWREQMEERKPDLFLCESAWSGSDSTTRPWKGRVYASTELPDNNRTELLGILEYCRQNAIPTVFWNKEDPSHYYDRRHDFVKTALLFDHIFTTDAACVDKYKLDYGHPSVHCLPFAAQPRLFNPISNGSIRSDEVIFTGAWYENHEQRSRAMELMFDAVIKSGRSLKIYDRFYGGDDPLHQFPEIYRSCLNPPVPHAELGRVYKESSIGMTINTETKSRTMFARRVFELMASNTFVVSNNSKGIRNFFGDGVVYLDSEPGRLLTLTDEEMSELRKRNLETVLSGHTYRERMATILDVAGVSYLPEASERDYAVVVDSISVLRPAIDMLGDAPGSSGIRRTVLLSDTVEPLDAAAIVSDFNGRMGVTVASLPMFASGNADLRSCISCDRDLVLGSMSSCWPSSEELSAMSLHTQYAGAAIMKGSSSYQYHKMTSLSDSLLVPRTSILQFVTKLAKRAPMFVYEV